ncbi:MAG: SusC/RagA family TonB-linked outer membrane protein [Proteiniphilum sp.]|nr:SusC/RagA family TonB-linked outer membrane protein [Proteiniphilum sp.]
MKKNSIEDNEHLNKFNHTLKIMRISLFLLFFCSLYSQATNSYSQNMKLSLDVKSASIKEICEEIERKSDYRFIFAGDANKAIHKKVNITVDAESIDHILHIILYETELSYRILDNQVVVYRNKEKAIHKEMESVVSNQILQQEKKAITGKVVDVQGEPVIGANIVETGTTNGTITNVDGEFSLHVGKNATIRISYIGYLEQLINCSEKTSFEIILREDMQSLEEVVVVGYGVQRKSDLTGAVGSVKVEDALKTIPSADISNALQGSLAGVAIVSGTGDPSKDQTIRIRGVNSISSDSQPLVVVDGFIGGSLKSLNPSDIQSIEVLKDASATAVYGSQGANGVILVTTRKPQKDKLIVSIHSFTSLQTIYDYPDVLSPGEFAKLANAYGQEYFPSMTNPQPPVVYYTDDQIKAFENGTAGFNYMKAIFNNPAVSQNHDLSISGGSKKTTYLASVRYAGSDGVVKKSRNDAVNYRLKIDNEIRPWLSAGFNVYGDYSNSRGPRIDPYEGLLQTALNWPSTAMPKNPDGTYSNVFPVKGLAAYNPMAYIDDCRNVFQTLNSNIQTYTEITFNKDLKFRSQFGVAFTQSLDQSTFDSKSYFYFKNNRTQASAKSAWNLNWLNTNILNYTKEFNVDHRVNATAVFEQFYFNKYHHKSTSELLAFDLGYDALAWADKFYTSSEREISTLMSGMMRINYVFKNRYMITASYRADGSSRLQNKWDYFPSFALAWDAAQENFMKNQQLIGQMKFRVGYGVVGNQAIAPYSTYSRMVPVANSDGTTSYVVGRPASPDLSWERNEQLNVGVDISLCKGRFTLTADWYNKVSKDILLHVAQPDHTGWPSLLKNAGEITNKGFEVTLGAEPFASETFHWLSNLSLSFNEGIYSKIPTPSKMQAMGVTGISNNPLAIFQMVENERIASFYGYIDEGIWKSDEVTQPVTITNADGSTTTGTYASIYKVVPGQIKIKDVNGDGKFNFNDQRIIGRGLPVFNWGWNNTLRYKDVDISLFIVGFHGFDIYNATDQSGYPGSINGVAQDAVTPKRDFLHRWTKDNEDTNIPGFVYVSSALQGFTSRFVEKGDFVKMKSITLGYNLPENLCQLLKIESLRVYGSVQNVLMFTQYTGLDPEATLGNPLTSGVDWGNYPNGRSFIAGLSFSF